MIVLSALAAVALLPPPVLECPDKGMSAAHYIYIPGMIVLGLVLGFLLGTRAVRAEAAAQRRKAEAKAAKAPPAA